MTIVRDPQQQLDTLRKYRRRRERETSIHDLVAQARQTAKRDEKRLGSLVRLWEECIPPALAARTALNGLRRGVLHVRVDSAATGFELDRVLRSGAEAQLRAAYRGTLLRVRTKIGLHSKG